MRRILSNLTFLSALLDGQTFVVDAGGGGQFRDLPQAVAAVPSGAVLRVRPGRYSEFAVAGKSLTIVGDSAQTVTVYMWANDITLGPTTAAESLVCMGMTWMSLPNNVPRNVRLDNLAGPVHLEDVTIGSPILMVPDTEMLVRNCANVHLVRCSLIGGLPARPDRQRLAVVGSALEVTQCTIGGQPGLNMFPTSPAAPPAMRVDASTIVCVGSSVTGGVGAAAFLHQALDGGAGGAAMLLGSGSVLHAYGAPTSIAGGAGGNVLAPTIGRGGDGGPGLQLVGSTALLVGVSPSGGTGGNGTTGVGVTGLPLVADAGSSVRTVPGAGPHVALLGQPAPGATVTFVLDASPGEPTALVVGGAQTLRTFPPLLGLGALLVEPWLVAPGFVVSTAGRLSLSITLPSEWPLDRLVLAQFLVLASPRNEIWAANSLSILARS